jgi:hypothetical protein
MNVGNGAGLLKLDIRHDAGKRGTKRGKYSSRRKVAGKGGENMVKG